MGVFDPDPARFHSQDLPRGVPELEYISLQALNRKVFVDGSDLSSARLQHHGVIGGIGYRSAGGDGGEPGAAASAQPAVDSVVVQISASAAAASRVALSQHSNDGIEIVPPEIAIRIGVANHFIKRVLGPLIGCNRGDDLLSQDVQRLLRYAEPVQLAPAHGVNQRY